MKVLRCNKPGGLNFTPEILKWLKDNYKDCITSDVCCNIPYSGTLVFLQEMYEYSPQVS